MQTGPIAIIIRDYCEFPVTLGPATALTVPSRLEPRRISAPSQRASRQLRRATMRAIAQCYFAKLLRRAQIKLW